MAFRVVVLAGGMDLPVALSNALRPFDRLCDVPTGSELSLDGGVSFATVRRPALRWTIHGHNSGPGCQISQPRLGNWENHEN